MIIINNKIIFIFIYLFYFFFLIVCVINNKSINIILKCIFKRLNISVVI